MKLQVEQVRLGRQVTITIYKTPSGEYVVADQAGWLGGSYPTREAALEFARKSNGMGV